MLITSPITASLFFVHWNSQHLPTKPHCWQVYLGHCADDLGLLPTLSEPHILTWVKTPGQRGAVWLFVSPHFSCPLLSEVTDQQPEGPKWSQPRLQVDSTIISCPLCPHDVSQRKQNSGRRRAHFAFHMGVSCGGEGLTQVCKLAQGYIGCKEISRKRVPSRASCIHNWGQLVWFSAQGVTGKGSNSGLWGVVSEGRSLFGIVGVKLWHYIIG